MIIKLSPFRVMTNNFYSGMCVSFVCVKISTFKSWFDGCCGTQFFLKIFFKIGMIFHWPNSFACATVPKKCDSELVIYINSLEQRLNFPPPNAPVISRKINGGADNEEEKSSYTYYSFCRANFIVSYGSKCQGSKVTLFMS